MFGHTALVSLALLALKTQLANAVAVYGQCGGISYTGSTVCDAGSTCVYSNAYYSQCLPGTAVSTTTSTTSTGATKTTTSSAASSSATLTSGSNTCVGARTKFKYFGVNQSCAEFGNTNIPGVLGTDYTWPSTSSIDYFVGKGFNTFRVAFLMERLVPPANGITGAYNAAYLSGLTTTVNYITGKGGYAILDPHNYLRYNGAVIASSTAFAGFWTNLSNQFKSNANVIFDLNNEPYGIDATVVFSYMQAAITAIRAAGATNLILVEGTSWTGAWTWTSSGNAAAFTGIKDPLNNMAIEMHQYLDSDGSGTSGTCVSATIGAERLADATAWLKANNLKGYLGEIGAGSNADCISAVFGALCELQTSGVWIGATWWAAGPWWPADYFTSIEPPNGYAIPSILPQALIPFL